MIGAVFNANIVQGAAIKDAGMIENPSAPRERLIWLDVLRGLCAFEIVGFHWLRAATKVNLYAPQSGSRLHENLILTYRGVDGGISGAFQFFTAAGDGSFLHRVLVDTLGVLFGFGWEAVFVFVLLSGASLVLSTSERQMPSWPKWIYRRAKRILLPYYIIASVVTVSMLGGLALSSLIHNQVSHLFSAINLVRTSARTSHFCHVLESIDLR